MAPVKADNREALMKLSTILVSISILLLTGACAGSREGGGANSNGPAPAAGTGDARDALKQAYRNMEAKKSFRARLMTTGAPGEEFDSTLEVVLPDRFRMSSEQMEMIIVGSTAYMKIGGQWRTVATELETTSLTDPKRLEDEFNQAEDVRSIGAEVLDGTPTRIYEAVLKVTEGKDLPGPAAQIQKVRIWIGVGDGLPRKLEGEDPDTKAKTVVSYYDYGAAITIEPPIK